MKRIYKAIIITFFYFLRLILLKIYILILDTHLLRGTYTK